MRTVTRIQCRRIELDDGLTNPLWFGDGSHLELWSQLDRNSAYRLGMRYEIHQMGSLYIGLISKHLRIRLVGSGEELTQSEGGVGQPRLQWEYHCSQLLKQDAAPTRVSPNLPYWLCVRSIDMQYIQLR